MTVNPGKPGLPEAPATETEEPEPYRGVIAIEWPAASGASPYACLTGGEIKITDAVTGKPVTTCTRLVVTAAVLERVTVTLVMFADEAGDPVLDGEPVVKDGETLTGTFPFAVSEMSVRAR